MRNDLLIMFWLNGRIQFVARKRGHSPLLWACEESVDLENAAELARVVTEAIRQTSFAGKNLAIVLEHPALTQQLVETPPAKGRDLENFIDRQVDQLKIFPEEGAWGFHPAHPTRSSHSVILYLLPARLREGLRAAAREAGLHLLILVPPSELLMQLIAESTSKDTENWLLAVDLYGTVSLVAARSDGALLLSRSLHSSWNEEPERIASQINRSMVFIRQQFGVDITRVHLMGHGAAKAAAAMATAGFPVTSAPPEAESSWPLLVSSISPKVSANLITRAQQRAPRRRLELMVCAAALALATLFSLVASLGVEWKLQQMSRKVAGMQPLLSDLRQRKAHLHQESERLKANVELASYVRNQRLPPIPAIFLAYLSGKLPDELVLTRLHVARVDQFSGLKKPPPRGRWTLRLEGCASWQAASSADPANVQRAYLNLVDELAKGPFQVLITNRTSLFAPRRQKPSWTTSAQDQSEHFAIEGYLGENPSQPP